MASYGFHPEAAEEYLAATQYYFEQASPLIAAAFVAEIETAIQSAADSNALPHRSKRDPSQEGWATFKCPLRGRTARVRGSVPVARPKTGFLI